MAQAMLDDKNYKLKILNEYKVNACAQTGEVEEFFIELSKSKHARIYFSKSYKDTVLSLNINQCKSFIITRSMWKLLKANIHLIDQRLSKNESAN